MLETQFNTIQENNDDLLKPFDLSENLLSFLGGRRNSDDEQFLAVAREMGRLLNSVANFFRQNGIALSKTAKAADVLTLTPAQLKDLGAPSLLEFYALALPDLQTMPLRLSPFEDFFPEGPESLADADQALKEILAELNYFSDEFLLDDGGPQTQLTYKQKIFLEKRVSLVRINRFWQKLKKMALAWPDAVKVLWQKAQNLDHGVDQLLNRARNLPAWSEDSSTEEYLGSSFTAAALSLKKMAGKADEHLAFNNAFLHKLENFSQKTEGLTAAFLNPQKENYDWDNLRHKLSAKLMLLDEGYQKLREFRPQLSLELSSALEKLLKEERRLTGRRQQESLEKAEYLLDGVTAMWNNLLARRRLMARFYFYLPKKIGRPLYLEKMFLLEALALGRSQALVESLKHKLEIFTGRLSSTHKLRTKVARLLEKLAEPEKDSALLKEAHRRFFIFSQLLDKENEQPDGISGRKQALVRENLELNQKISSLNFEKKCLNEELLSAQASLTQMGRLKARLLKVLAEKKQKFNNLLKKDKFLNEENSILKGELERIRRKRIRLMEVYRQSRQKLSELVEEQTAYENLLKQSEESLERETHFRQKLLARLAQSKSQLKALHEEKIATEKKLQQKNEDLAEQNVYRASLEAELLRYQEELTESSKAREGLSESLGALRLKFDRLTLVQKALSKSLKLRTQKVLELEKENQSLTVRLGRQKQNVLRLAGYRHDLLARLGDARLRLHELENEKDKIQQFLLDSRRTNEDLLGEKEKLANELSEIKAHFENDLAPLFDVMQEALRQSEKEKEAKSRTIIALNQKYVDFQMAANFQISQSEQALSAFQATGDQLAKDLKTLKDENEIKEKEHLALSLLLVILSQKLDEKQSINEALALQNSELLNLAQKQGLDLEQQKEHLAGLLFLIDNFLKNSVAQERENSGFRTQLDNQNVLVGLLRKESSALTEQLEKEISGGKNLAQEKEALAQKLLETKPLLTFLVNHFVANVAQLAQAEKEMADLLAQKKLWLSWDGNDVSGYKIEALKNRLLTLEKELSAAHEKMAALEDSSTASNTIDSHETEILKANLAARQSELVEVGAQAFSLAREKNELKVQLAEKENEISLLRQRLLESQTDLAENDGRLEASWAALTYLAAKSGDHASALEEKLNRQALVLDSVQNKLLAKEAELKKLTDKQNRLALLTWTLISNGDLNFTLPADLPVLGTAFDYSPYVLTELEEGAGNTEIIELKERLPETDENQVETQNQSSAEGGAFSQSFLGVGGKVARGAIFSLVLAGSLVLGLKNQLVQVAEAATPSYQLTAASSVHLPLLGRQFDLSPVGLAERHKGEEFIVSTLKNKIISVGEKLNLDRTSFFNLLRQAYQPHEIISLYDLEIFDAFQKLSRPHFPGLCNFLATKNNIILSAEEKSFLLKTASEMSLEESHFWDRLFTNFCQTPCSGKDAVTALLDHLKYRQSGRLMGSTLEYAGLLAPSAEFEKMSFSFFQEFMSSFIKDNWQTVNPLSQKVKAQKAQDLAADIYNAAHLFKMPVTFLSLNLHALEQDAIFDAASPNSTLFIYSFSRKLTKFVRNFTQNWQKDRPGLCDLDEIFTEISGQDIMTGQALKLKLMTHYRQNFVSLFV